MIYEMTIGGKTARSTLGQHPVQIDWDALPDASKDFAARYGLKQYLADAMAGAENEADAKARIEARLAKLVAGDLTRTRGEAKDAPDTLEGRAIKLAKAAVRKAMSAANVKAEKEAVADAAKKLVETQPKWREDAQAQLDMEKATADSMDGSDLLAMLGIAPKED